MYYVYALKSTSGKYIYVGMTNNPTRRAEEHNNRKESTTRAYAPFHTLTFEKYKTRKEARAREKYLKSGAGKSLSLP